MIYLFDKKQLLTGVLDENTQLLTATLEMKINEASTLEFSLPIDDGLSKKMAVVKYIGVPSPNDNSKIIFLRLMTINDTIDRVEYMAKELAYQELSTKGYIEDKRPEESDATTLMNIALDGSGYKLGLTNVSGIAKTNFYYTDHLSAISNVVDLLGGEIYFYVSLTGSEITGRYMDYVAEQGTNTSKTFSDGSNLITVERKSDMSSVYTAILPRGKGEQVSSGEGDSPDGYGRRIDISDINWSKGKGDPLEKAKGSKILADPDATKEYGNVDGSARLLLKTYDDIEDPKILINKAYADLVSVNKPAVQYSATVADVGDMQLGDTIVIMHSKRNMSYRTRIFQITYDLLDNSKTVAEFGNDMSSNSITNQINSISSNSSTISDQVQWNVSNGGHNNTSYGSQEPVRPRKGDVWYKQLPNGNTEQFYFDGTVWVLGATTDQQWKENQAIAQGTHTTFYGTKTPTGAVKGDVWFKNDNNEPDGKAMYTYDGSNWIKFDGSADASRLQIGTIDAAKINVLNISASNIVTGTLSANFIKGGQIDASQVNVINMNANNIVTGSIRGANLDINLNTGQVEFRKGRMHSTSGSIDVNIDQGYLSVTNSQNNVLIKDGEIAFTQPNIFNPSTNPYIRITNDMVNGSFGFGTIQAKEGMELNVEGHVSNTIDALGIQTLSGVKFGIGHGGSLEKTIVGGANKGVLISGGALIGGATTLSASPYIKVGATKGGLYGGDRIEINASYLHVMPTYSKTSSSGANVYVAPDGALVRSTSARKYKTNIEHDVSIDYAQKLLDVPLSTWDDIAELRDTGKSSRYFGMIAEDLADAGLDYLVTRGEDNQIEGIEYSRVALLLIPIVKELQQEIKSLRDNVNVK